MSRWQVLLDANNFFVSCERVFQPDLLHKPLVVMSSNEGCVLARSNEAKCLGVLMGESFFQLRERQLHHQLRIRCCNFPLYSDMSRRLMTLVSHYLPRCEIYSIDEAFGQLDEPDLEKLLKEMAHIRASIWRLIGLPVSLAAATTRVRAKLAIDEAKKQSSGVMVMEAASDEWLKRCSIGQVWGVGRRLDEKLRSHGIYTAYELASKELSWVKTVMGFEGERLALELRGVACKNRLVSRHQSMQLFRTFAHHLTDKALIGGALSQFAHSMGEKLRLHQLCACSLAIQFYEVIKGRPVLVHESLHRFSSPSSDTRDLLKACQEALHELPMPIFGIKKAGIAAVGLISQEQLGAGYKGDLFSPTIDSSPTSDRLMRVLDQVKERFGKNKINLGPLSSAKEWEPRSDSRSSCFTTSWDGLARVRL